MTSNFQGEFNNAIDAKGRASIPAVFRETLAGVYGDDRLVVTQDDGGLAAYPASEWHKIVEKVNAMPPGKVRDAINLALVSPARDYPFDKQGRIQLSKAQRCYAGLESEIREIVVVGAFNRIMIWNRATHDQRRRQAEELLRNEAQIRYDLGF
jgi:MraZ protein